MVAFFQFFAYLSTIIGMIIVIILGVLYVNNTKSIAKNEQITKQNKQLKRCKVISGLFIVADFLLVSCESKDQCLLGYQELSNTCSILGLLWFLMTFLIIVVNIYLIMKNNNAKHEYSLSSLRRSCSITGIIFFLLSFVLDVKQ